MLNKSGILGALLLGASLLLSSCAQSGSVVGDWYSVDNPDEYLTLKSDGQFEVHQKDNIVQGEWSVDDTPLMLDFGYLSGYFTIDTFDNINVVFGHMSDEIFAYGKENAEKLHNKDIDKEDIINHPN